MTARVRLRRKVFFEYVSFLAIVAGIAYGAVELRNLRLARERDAALELFRATQTSEFSRAVAFIYALPDSLNAAELQDRLAADIGLVQYLLRTWEGLGILVYRGDVPLKAVDDFYGGPILRSWATMKPVVEVNRSRQGPRSNEWFQWLVERLREADWGDLEPAYKAHAQWRPPR